jgi:hypothetical protein
LTVFESLAIAGGSNTLTAYVNIMYRDDRHLKYLKDEISTWSGVSVHPHRFGGTEFRFGNAEVGHLHDNGTLDIPFPRALRDELLAQGLAEEHQWVPDSGWSTFRVRSEKEGSQATWLMRLSYLRYALKKAADPSQMLALEGAKLQLNPRLQRLLEQLLPRASISQ